MMAATASPWKNWVNLPDWSLRGVEIMFLSIRTIEKVTDVRFSSTRGLFDGVVNPEMNKEKPRHCMLKLFLTLIVRKY